MTRCPIYGDLVGHEDEEMKQVEHKHIEVIAGLSFGMDKLWSVQPVWEVTLEKLEGMQGQ